MRLYFLPAVLCLLLPSFAHAQDASGAQTQTQKNAEAAAKDKDDRNYVTLTHENDMFNGTDRYYTSGAQASWFNVGTQVPDIIDDIAESIPTFDINESTSTVYTLGQNLYTPEDIDTRIADPDDRPYAAWLYGSVGLVTTTDQHVDEVEVTLGVVGPEALGEQTQKFIHENISDSPVPEGWDSQLDFEPGVVLSWQRRFPEMAAGQIGDLYVRAVPNVNVSLGNIYTYAGTGVSFTLGPYTGREQDTPPRVRPAVPGTGYFDTPEDEFSWFLFASLDARLMGRNIFLDGNTFKDGPSVDKKPLVGDASVGAAITFDDYRLSYSYNVRSKEFDGQDKASTFSAISLGLRF